MRKTTILFLAVLFSLSFYSCRESTREKTEEAVESIGEDIEEGARKTGEEIEKGAEKVEREIDEEIHNTDDVNEEK